MKLELGLPTGVDSSGTDVSLTGLATKSLGRLSLHANAGYAFLSGEDPRERDGRYEIMLGASYPIGAPHYTRLTVLEGTILYMPTALPGMSVTEAGKVLQSMDRQLRSFPEVERVFGKAGRSTSATDNAPLSMVETVVTLKPQVEWRAGLTREGLIAEMDERLRYPGMPNVWWMPIQTRTEMLATGIRSNLGIKVFGPNLAGLQKAAVGIERALQDDPRTRPYTRNAFAERLTGGYFLDFGIDRERIARHGTDGW